MRTRIWFLLLLMMMLLVLPACRGGETPQLISHEDDGLIELNNTATPKIVAETTPTTEPIA